MSKIGHFKAALNSQAEKFFPAVLQDSLPYKTYFIVAVFWCDHKLNALFTQHNFKHINTPTSGFHTL